MAFLASNGCGPEQIDRDQAAPLAFHIAATGDPDRFASAFQSLEEDGPDADPGADWKWFPVMDIAMFVDEDEREDLEQHGTRTFFERTLNLIADEHEGTYYLLLSTHPDRRLTEDDGDWKLESVHPTSDDHTGRSSLNFTLDAQGGQAMSQLTARNIGEPMAILVDDQVVAAPTIRSEIRQGGEITLPTQEHLDELMALLTGQESP